MRSISAWPTAHPAELPMRLERGDRISGLTPFGQALRRYRLNAGLTQEELAEQSNLGVRTISDWERGVRAHPRRETVLLVAEGLGLNAVERDDLLASRRRAVSVSPEPGPVGVAPAVPSTNDEWQPPLSILPAPVSSLVGRQREIEAVLALLKSDSRLVALTGSPGIGKTRLGLAVAEALQRDVSARAALVDLSNVDDVADVLPTIGLALGIRPAANQEWLAALTDTLRVMRTFLLLDNVDRVVAAGAKLASLLSASPTLQILVTSREALRIAGEREYQVQPLELPSPSRRESISALMACEAVRLFVERSRDVRPEFALTEANGADVAEICRRLDGLPLAIERAAARSRSLTPREILKRLDDRLSLLTEGARDVPVRQQTLRNAIAWSYDSLPANEQRLFRLLSVFPGGCTFEAISATIEVGDVSGIELLNGIDALLGKSLLKTTHDVDASRYAMLETLREFGSEKLRDAGEIAQARRRHEDYFLRLSERCPLDVWLPNPAASSSIYEVDRERDNLRAALRTAAATHDPIHGFRWGAAIGWFWWHDLGGLEVAPSQALFGAAYLAWLRGDYTSAEDLFAEARRGWTDGDALDVPGVSRSRPALELVTRWETLDASAHTAFYEALARARDADDETAIAWALHHLGWLSFFRGDREPAAHQFAESQNIFRQSGDQHGLAATAFGLGWLARENGEVETAVRHFVQSLTNLEVGHSPEMVSHVLANLATLATRRGNYPAAAHLIGASARAYGRSGRKHPPALIAFYERELQPCRQTLMTIDYDRAWAEGGGLTLDELRMLIADMEFPVENLPLRISMDRR
jgi:predicted ATPase/transcriptional regulator with XRE-family HTH domain